VVVWWCGGVVVVQLEQEGVLVLVEPRSQGVLVQVEDEPPGSPGGSERG